MNERAICEVMLYSYKDLEKKCELVDKCIYKIAIHSAFKDTEETLRGIETLIREKITYINTKVVIDKALAQMKRKYELIQHYVNGVSIEQLADNLNVSYKGMYSRIFRQRETLYEIILSQYNGGQLLDFIYDSEWLMHRYKQALNGQ